MKKSVRNGGGSRADGGDVALYWKQPRPQVHKFVRNIQLQDIPKTAVNQGFAIAFTLNDLPDVSEFTSLFDQYRLDWVEYTFVLRKFAAGSSLPVIYYAEDHDDSNLPSFAAICEAQNVQIVTFGSDRTMIKFRITPNVLRQVYNGLTSGYERAPPGVWLDCANSAIPHYGVKYVIENYNTTDTPNNVVATSLRYHVSFKETI
jgi:hypothetical protein